MNRFFLVAGLSLLLGAAHAALAQPFDDPELKQFVFCTSLILFPWRHGRNIWRCRNNSSKRL